MKDLPWREAVAGLQLVAEERVGKRLREAQHREDAQYRASVEGLKRDGAGRDR